MLTGIVAPLFISRWLREFCLTPRILCRFCSHKNQCALRNMHLRIVAERRLA